MPKKSHVKSARQVRYLLSKGSPLSGKERDHLLGELHSGMVKIRKDRSKKDR